MVVRPWEVSDARAGAEPISRRQFWRKGEGGMLEQDGEEGSTLTN